MNKKTLKILIISIVIVIIFAFSYAYIKGLFYIEEIIPSPQGDVTTIVYNKDITEFPFSSEKAFTVSDIGEISGRTTYSTAEFKDLYWAPDGKYRVISLKWDNEGNYLEINDFINNSSSNLTTRLQTVLHTEESISELLVYSEYPRPIVDFKFISWTGITGEMEISFSFVGNDAKNYDGSFKYNYENNTNSEIILN